MTVAFIEYRAEHLAAVKLQEAQRDQQPEPVSLDVAQALEAEASFTMTEDGTPIACFGIVVMEAHRGLAWAYLSERAGKYLRRMTRMCWYVMHRCGLQRVEATVDVDYVPGHRWMRLLGFEMECPRMRAYRADGRDHALYAKVFDHG